MVKKAKENVIEEDFIDDDNEENQDAPAGKGHNKPPKTGDIKNVRVGGVAVDQMKSIISRVEKLLEEKAGITADIADVWAEAKGNGFDVKALKKIIAIRKLDASEREEQETILDTYMHALGMLPEFTDGRED